MKNCRLCHSTNISEIYKGSIRDGQAGSISSESYTVIRCSTCGVRYLDPLPVAEYASDQYREKYNSSAAPEHYYRLHDPIALNYLTLLEGVSLRGKVVCDAGCGGGTFLDAVKGLAKTTIGIEPNDTYRRELEKKGHRVYPGIQEVCNDLGDESLDVITSFHVIEHVPDPCEFLGNIYRLKKKDGIALIVTPNSDDILLGTGIDSFNKFYYRTVHPWYFNRTSLEFIARKAGVVKFSAGYRHNFNFSNFYTWMVEGRPSGNNVIEPFNKSLDATWQSFLTESGHSDEIFLEVL